MRPKPQNPLAPFGNDVQMSTEHENRFDTPRAEDRP